MNPDPAIAPAEEKPSPVPPPPTRADPVRWTSVQDIDWKAWRPHQDATLLFVVRGGRMLLIHKKRGLGAGKINAPGGRIEPGETAREAAVREVEEELRIRVRRVRRCGVLCFQFVDGLALRATVFRAAGYAGEPRETDEAAPLWVDLDAIPYERMWQDDPLWVPLMLRGEPFLGFFLFDGDRMVHYRMEEPRRPPRARPAPVHRGGHTR